MSIHKNMEVIFVTALVAVGVGSYLLDSLPEVQAQTPTSTPIARDIATPTTMAVVIIKATRARGIFD